MQSFLFFVEQFLFIASKLSLQMRFDCETKMNSVSAEIDNGIASKMLTSIDRLWYFFHHHDEFSYAMAALGRYR